MNLSGVFDTVDSLYEEYKAFWAEICRIESPSNHKPGVDAVNECFIRRAREKGWQVEILPQPVAGDAVCITMNPDAPGKPVCMSGHTDTVHPLGLFGEDPVRFEDGKIFGPGVYDCKGGLVMGLLAMDALDRCGFRERPIRLLLQSDEEVGSRLSQKATINWICEKAKDAAAFLNLEPSGEGTLCVQRKGIIVFTFTVTGEEAHSALCAEKGANAIAEAAHKIIELEKLKDRAGITCSCNIISGGTAHNTVPAKCTFKADVRYATAAQEAWIHEHMQKVADAVYVPGCRTEVTHPKGRPAMELNERNQVLADRINALFVENGFEELPIVPANGGSDAAYVTLAGIPCIDRVGVLGSNAHSVREFSHLSSLGIPTKRLALLCARL